MKASFLKYKTDYQLFTKRNISILCFVFFQLAQAQLETANWYFGRNAGIRFDPISGTVSAVTDGRLVTLEGCASISDRSGNLLFYTDGVTVFNRNHQVMANGSGLNGDFSSTQSAIILPKPNDPNIYYIFTVDEPHHLNADGNPQTADPQGDDINHGLNYSVVDMRLSGGNGAIVSGQKNISLVTYDTNDATESAFKSAEKITAVRAADCKSIWIISHFVDRFYAFKVGENGVDDVPVVSQLPPVNPLSGYRRNALGYLKASPDGDKLGIAHFGFATERGGDGPGGIYLYDFDNDTGLVSNPITLYEGDSPYGIEFSPDGTKMYASLNLGFAGEGPALIFQYNLLSPDIRASQATINMSTVFEAPSLQIGLDNKIYVSQLNFDDFQSGKYLSIIENPNAPAAAINFITDGIFLDIGNNNQHLSQIGLPPFVQSFFSNRIDIIRNGQSSQNLPLCEGASFTFSADTIAGAVYTWSKDDVILPETGPSLTLNNVQASDQGIYRVSIDLQDGTCPLEGEAALQVISLSQTQDATLVQCDPDADGQTLFDLSLSIADILNGQSGIGVTFHNSADDATNNVNPVGNLIFENTSAPQVVYARVEANASGCFAVREVRLEISADMASDAQLEVCDEDGNADGFAQFDLSQADATVLNGLVSGLSISYYLTQEDALIQNNPLPQQYRNVLPNTQIVYARVSSLNNCVDIAEITLQVRPLPVLPPDETRIICLNANAPTVLNAGVNPAQVGNFTYLWNTGETTPSIRVSQAGSFSVIVTNVFGCTAVRNFTLDGSDVANITDIAIEDLTDNNRIEVFVSGIGDYEFALDFEEGPYQDSAVFENVLSGFHTVFVRDKNGCGIVSEEIAVLGIPKFFTPNGDGFNDTWQVRGLPPELRAGTKIFIFDRFGKLLKDLAPNGVGWDGTYRNQQMPSTDYWYRIEFANGRTARGHFTLKR
ncbi:MAG: T9SS type B sorting domain-containing protein [Flavobacteriaceae bacterium]|nr:T9SS type B sorting domain-containing protein [Flavobacteriaceae bacterium]